MAGKVAIITGGSQGIGAGLVAAYRGRGWSVVANARTIKPSPDPGVLTVAGDIADPATADRVTGAAPLFLPGPVNEHLFHLMFNRLPTMNVQLVHGREDIFFGFIFAIEAFKKLPSAAVRIYIDNLAASLASLRGSFGFYRALDSTTAQNVQRAKKKLTLPVLAIGGAESAGKGVGDAMKLAATNVQTLVIPGCGHFVAEEAPKQLLAALTAFLAASRAAHNAGPQAAGV